MTAKAQNYVRTRIKTLKVKYKDKLLGEQRIDFIVEDEIILEIKSTKEIGNIHIAQILSYLKTLNKRLGLILNFGESKLGIKRVVNGL
ncbi:MAG: GxxExxY protein [Nitrospirota bacterium]